jgi:uncharacterized Ntn-hydrolase superfamily protein
MSYLYVKNNIMKFLLKIMLAFPFFGLAQHTFSIVAVDSLTGEIGSAGATCGDSIIWPGTPGAYLISDLIPGVGAIHSQSYYLLGNQINANTRMDLGDAPQDIINWLVANDVQSDPSIRQYGIVDYNGGSPRSAAYTGAACFDYKNHILGSNYAIQGNILLGQEILDAMEIRFNNTNGCLSEKLMAAMQGANVIGADTRCTTEGTSSLSAFLRVAKATDHPDSLFLDLNIAGTATGVEPINELQAKYDVWKLNNTQDCLPLRIFEEIEALDLLVFPNPTDGVLHIQSSNEKISRIEVTSIQGSLVLVKDHIQFSETDVISLESLINGTYFVAFYDNKNLLATKKLTLLHE